MERASTTLELDGKSLDPEGLAHAAGPGGRICIAPKALERMAEGRRILLGAIAEGRPVYGVTRGLGSRAGESLAAEAIDSFSIETLKGRAHAIGEPLPVEAVRAAMIVRLNTLLLGAAGASPGIAEGLRDALNEELTPVVGATGSVGASDLLLGAAMGAALAGEGMMLDRQGWTRSAAEALAAAGLPALALGPRDGLALCSHSCFSSALAALGLASAATAIPACQAAAALSCTAFGANASPFDARVLALKGQDGEERVAAELRWLLHGTAIEDPGNARRLQDPLSFRNLAQIHGAAYAAERFLRRIVGSEINGSSDNPAVLIETGEVLSTGNFQAPQLTIGCEALARALAFAATLTVARLAKLLAHRFTELTQSLGAAGSNGLAPMLKIAEALLAEIHSLAMPVPIWPSVGADGIEDALTNSFLAARRLADLVTAFDRLTAIELIIAAQAIDLRGADLGGAAPLCRIHQFVRSISAPYDTARPLGGEIMALAGAIGAGKLQKMLQR